MDEISKQLEDEGFLLMLALRFERSPLLTATLAA